MKKIISLIFIIITTNVLASSKLHLEKVDIDIYNKESLQNGAKMFMNYCSSCHSIGFMRYNRIGQDLGISEKQIVKNLIFGNNKTSDLIVSNINKKDSNKWFGVTPPDLSLTVRVRGVDWVYNYLNGFYTDNSRPFGVNNHILKNAAMPDILWQLKSTLSKNEFERKITDITNFLDYVSEPAKLIRTTIGYWVLAFLAFLLIFTYLLKKEYWLDVKYGKWRVKK